MIFFNDHLLGNYGNYHLRSHRHSAEDPISQAQQVGFAVTITGVLLWSRLKLQEQVRKGEGT